MTGQRVIAPGAGELVGDSPDRRVEILCDDDRLHATWSRFGPGREGADLHVHRRHTDLFYVLEGELTIRLGIADDEVAVPAGTLARVPPMVVHGFRNASGAEVSYLNLHAPGRGFADFMRGLRDGREVSYDQEPPPAEGTRPVAEAVVGEPGFATQLEGMRAAPLAEVDAIAISELEADPGATFPPAPEARGLEALYVLAGELAVDPADDGRRAVAGTWVTLPPDAACELAVVGSNPARLLHLRAPGTAFR